MEERYKIASGECKLNAVVFEINDESNIANKVYRINI